MKRIVLLSLVLAFATTGAAVADETRWINVKVDEADTNVELHLPLSLILSIVEGIEVDGFEAGKVDLEIDDMDIDWVKILAAVKDAPGGDFVDVKADDGNVEISKKNGFVHIMATETGGGNSVANVTMPVSILSAFSVDDQNRIDIAAMLTGLAELPVGDLVRVTSDDANVRIWVE